MSASLHIGTDWLTILMAKTCIPRSRLAHTRLSRVHQTFPEANSAYQASAEQRCRYTRHAPSRPHRSPLVDAEPVAYQCALWQLLSRSLRAITRCRHWRPSLVLWGHGAICRAIMAWHGSSGMTSAAAADNDGVQKLMHAHCSLPQVSPRGDRVLVKVGAEETKTRGGILLPVSAVKKPTSGTSCCNVSQHAATRNLVNSGPKAASGCVALPR